jgi:hypothetical protein
VDCEHDFVKASSPSYGKRVIERDLSSLEEIVRRKDHIGGHVRVHWRVCH